MSPRRTRRRLAWAVPSVTTAVVAAAALVVGGVLPTAASAEPHPDLAARTPAQLLAAVGTATTTALSGTVVARTELGLPSLPNSGSSAALTLPNLLLGTHTARVWVDGPARQRVALLGQLTESDIVHDGPDVWTYASDTRQVDHLTLPANRDHTPSPATAMTPQALAQQAIAAIEPTTKVTVDRTEVVAGRPTYTLVLTPRDTASTVHQVLISVDAATSVPLRVQVYGTAGTPALQAGFTDVSFDRPAASVFDFTPPKGATVTELNPGGSDRATHAPSTSYGWFAYAPLEGTAAGAPTTDAQDHAGPMVHGSGWTSVLELAAGSQALDQLGETAQALTTTLPDGSRLLKSTLVNALITPDGRLFVGAVTPQALQALATGR